MLAQALSSLASVRRLLLDIYLLQSAKCNFFLYYIVKKLFIFKMCVCVGEYFPHKTKEKRLYFKMYPDVVP